MPSRPLQLALLALAAAWPGRAECAPAGCFLHTAQAHGPAPAPPGGRGPEGQAQTAPAPAACFLPGERPAPTRAEPRQPALGCWLTSGRCAAEASPPPGRSPPALPRPARATHRLHLLLCTWLT